MKHEFDRGAQAIRRERRRRAALSGLEGDGQKRERAPMSAGPLDLDAELGLEGGVREATGLAIAEQDAALGPALGDLGAACRGALAGLNEPRANFEDAFGKSGLEVGGGGFAREPEPDFSEQRGGFSGAAGGQVGAALFLGGEGQGSEGAGLELGELVLAEVLEEGFEGGAGAGPVGGAELGFGEDPGGFEFFEAGAQSAGDLEGLAGGAGGGATVAAA